MSIDTSSADNVVIEDVEVDVPVSPNRRALEVGAFILALTALVVFFYNALYIFVVNKYRKDQGAESFGVTETIKNFQLLATQQGYVLPVLALLTVVVAAVVRGIYANDERSKDRTIISVTIAILLGLVNTFVALFSAVKALTPPDANAQPTSQLPDSKLNRFSEMTGILPSLVLSIGVLIIAAIFIFGRSDATELETEDDWRNPDDEDEAVAVESVEDTETPKP